LEGAAARQRPDARVCRQRATAAGGTAEAILASWWQVLMLILLVVFGKWLINLSLGLMLPASATTMLVVAAGLSQIGEFTFIVGSLGVSLGVLSQEQYGLILAAATISIMVNPFMLDLIPQQEAFLKKRDNG
jgi:CPA2 family monovalent cation:H+ antiporter-2